MPDDGQLLLIAAGSNSTAAGFASQSYIAGAMDGSLRWLAAAAATDVGDFLARIVDLSRRFCDHLLCGDRSSSYFDHLHYHFLANFA